MKMKYLLIGILAAGFLTVSAVEGAAEIAPEPNHDQRSNEHQEIDLERAVEAGPVIRGTHNNRWEVPRGNSKSLLPENKGKPPFSLPAYGSKPMLTPRRTIQPFAKAIPGWRSPSQKSGLNAPPVTSTHKVSTPPSKPGFPASGGPQQNDRIHGGNAPLIGGAAPASIKRAGVLNGSDMKPRY